MNVRTRAIGFSLIEIMITVAIIAILAGIALPAYSSYTIRSKVSECLVLSSGPKLEVSERRARGATSLAGAAGNFTGTRYCADMQVADGGEIVMTTQDTGASVDPVLQLSPTGTGGDGWTCGYLAGDPKYLPANCRNLAVAVSMPPVASAPSAPSPGIDPFPGNPTQPPATPSNPGPSAPADPAPPAGSPAPSDPSPSDPAPSDPAPGDPSPPNQPQPDPTAPEPTPSDPKPIDPAPSNPAPIDPPPSNPPAPPADEDEDEDEEDDGQRGSRSWCEANNFHPPGLCRRYQ